MTKTARQLLHTDGRDFGGGKNMLKIVKKTMIEWPKQSCLPCAITVCHSNWRHYPNLNERRKRWQICDVLLNTIHAFCLYQTPSWHVCSSRFTAITKLQSWNVRSSRIIPFTKLQSCNMRLSRIIAITKLISCNVRSSRFIAKLQSWNVCSPRIITFTKLISCNMRSSRIIAITKPLSCNMR